MGTSENTAAVAAAYEAFGRGDIEAILAITAEDTIWQIHASSDSPLNGEYKGLDGVVEFFTKVGSLLEFARFEMAPIAAEGDTVVAVGDQEYTVTSTGTVVTGRLAHVYTFSSDGKVARFEDFEPGGDGAW